MDILTMTVMPAIAAYYDTRTGKIPNRLILAGAFGGLLRRMYVSGTWGAAYGILSGLVVLFLLLPVYRIRGIGAGDVKLLAATAVYVPLVRQGLMLVVLTFLAAGTVAVYMVLRRGELGMRLLALRGYVLECAALGRLVPYRPVESESSYMRLAPCVLCAACVICMEYLWERVL